MEPIKSLLKIIIYPLVFLFGAIRFALTGTNSNQAHLSLRYLFVFTNGKSNDFASAIITFFSPKYAKVKADGILGHLSDQEIYEIVKDLQTTGYHVFDTKLNPNQLADLVNFAKTTPVSYLEYDKKYITYSKEKVIFDSENPVSPRFQFTNSELLKNATVQDLAFDQSLLRIANSFLNTKPVLDIVSMWWSVPFGKEAEDRAAQKYHFDMDRLKFMKFFFYLTDVNTNTGPHCYVKGSSKNIPKPILLERRIEDFEMAKNYPSEDIVELTAPKGSIIAVDTRGFHKGKSLSEGNRLLLQFQFSNSVFGAPYNKIENCSISEQNMNIKNEKPVTYQLVNTL